MGQAHFITFSCYKNRRLLSRDRCKELVVEVLASQLAQRQGLCLGFVVMPDHVHALLYFAHPEQIADFMQQWKRLSSHQIKKYLTEHAPTYWQKEYADDPVWQHRYYCFEVIGPRKAGKKLEYMHQNPVRAGLVNKPVDWAHSSARCYLCGQAVGVKIEWPGEEFLAPAAHR